MTDWDSESVRFASVVEAMPALLSGDLAEASRRAGAELTGYFLDAHAVRLWQRRTAQIATDPPAADWIARAGVSDRDGVMGYAGFHGPPDEAGMVEIGYSVDPALRRRGHARAMLAALIAFCAREPAVTTVRVTISPDNDASLATLRGFGFERTGEQWDEEDGLELIFERPARPS